MTILKKQKQNCKHICILESNPILVEVFLIKSELGFTFIHKYQESPANCLSSSTPTFLTEPAKEAIFETKGNFNQIWHLDKLEVRKFAKCCTCGSTMLADKIFIDFKVLYIPPNYQFAKDRNSTSVLYWKASVENLSWVTSKCHLTKCQSIQIQ